MADNLLGITSGLFGVAPTQQSDMEYALKNFRGMTSADIGGAQLYAAGKGLGRGLMQAAGVEDPEMAAANKLKAAAAQVQQQGLDPKTSAGMKAIADIIQQSGDTATAMKAMVVANQMAQNEAQLGLTKAQTVKALREPDEGIKAIIQKSTPQSIAKYQQTGNVGDLELIDKGLTGAALTKVADAQQNISNLSAGNTEIDTWLTKVDPKKPSVTFGPGSSAAAVASNLVGSPTDNALEQAKLRRFIAREANDILVAAKGTQTEGDARRAYDLIMSGLDKNSNAGVYGALEDLKEAKQKVVKGLETYVSTVQGKGKTTTTTGVQSGKYADDYTKYKAKYGNQALPYEAYVAKREGR